MDKLNSLAARAMGWVNQKSYEGDIGGCWMDPADDGDHVCCSDAWNPSHCADDALILLEHASGESLWRVFGVTSKLKGCEIYLTDIPIVANSHTIPLAMTLCALRAAGIPESEITAAME